MTWLEQLILAGDMPIPTPVKCKRFLWMQIIVIV
jgi:hypothetical protein